MPLWNPVHHNNRPAVEFTVLLSCLWYGADAKRCQRSVVPRCYHGCLVQGALPHFFRVIFTFPYTVNPVCQSWVDWPPLFFSLDNFGIRRFPNRGACVLLLIAWLSHRGQLCLYLKNKMLVCLTEICVINGHWSIGQEGKQNHEEGKWFLEVGSRTRARPWESVGLSIMRLMLSPLDGLNPVGSTSIHS